MRSASLQLAGQLNALTSGSEVGVEQVEQAAQLILERGVSPDRIELYADKFFDAALEGRLPAETRHAYVEGLLRMVDALPAEAVPVIAVRAQRALTEELGQLTRTIAGYEVEIRELDRQLVEINARVTQKLERASQLNARRTELLQKIETANRQKQAVFVFAAVIGIFSLGVGAPIAGALGGSATLAIGLADAQRQIDGVRRELTQVDTESAALRSLAQAYEGQRHTYETNVAALRTDEASLREAAAAASAGAESPQVNLAVSLIIARSLANNLQQQIRVLREQLKSTKELEQQLDGMIRKLESEVTQLEARAEQAQRELLETILATVIALASLRPNFRAGPLSISKAKLLTRGVDFLRMSLQEQIALVINNGVVQGVLRATGANFAMNAIVRAIDIFDDGSLGRVPATGAGAMSEPQTYLLDLISRTKADIDRSTEAEAVRARGGLTDEQARREAKRLIQTLRPAAALLPIGSEIADWRHARALALEAEGMYRRLPLDPSTSGHREGLAAMRELIEGAQAKLRADTPAYRALGLFLSATAEDRALDTGFAGAGLYGALAILSLERGS